MRTRALVGGILLFCCLLGGPASAADVNELHTVDQYVAALREDPILVQQVMGAGHTPEVRRTLAALAAKLPYPVHVALVQAPTDLESDDISRDLASTFRRRIGAPGLYVVAVAGSPREIQATGTAVDPTELSLASTDVESAVSSTFGKDTWPSMTAALEVQIILETAASPGFAHYDFQSQQGKPVLGKGAIDDLLREPWLRAWRQPDVDSDSHVGKRWMIGTIAGLGSFLVIGTALVGWPGWRRTAKQRQRDGGRPQIEALRHDAEELLTSLATSLAALPPTPVHPDIAADALAAREAAEAALRGGYLDVAGALALARSGLADVGRAQQRNPGKPARSCYFNPLHGRAVGEVSWRYDDADVTVPACRRCVRAVGNGRTPDVLRVSESPSSKAYFEEKSVWASTGYGALVDHFGASVLRERGARS